VGFWCAEEIVLLSWRRRVDRSRQLNIVLIAFSLYTSPQQQNHRNYGLCRRSEYQAAQSRAKYIFPQCREDSGMRRFACALLFFVAFGAINSAQASSIRHHPRGHNVSLVQYVKQTYSGGIDGTFGLASLPDNWLGGTGNWSNVADWSAGLPGSTSDVLINTGNDNVTLDTNATINSLTLGGSSGTSSLVGDGNGHTVNVAGALTVNSSGNLGLNGDVYTIGGAATLNGMVSVDGGSIGVNGNAAIDGIVSLNGDGGFTVNGNAVISSTGNMLIGYSPNFGPGAFFVNGSLTNNGGITLVDSGVQVSGNMNNSGFISLQQARMGSGLDIGGTLTNSGDIEEESEDTADVLEIGRLINTASGNLFLDTNYNTINSLQNQGTITISPPGALFVGVAHTAASVQAGVTNSGNLYIDGDLTTNNYVQTAGQTTVNGSLTLAGRGMINFAGGSVFGDGTITGSVVSNAAFNLGEALMSIGQLAINGPYTQGLHGSLTADIAGAAPGQYDQLNVSGHAQLNGLLTVDLLNGFVPQIGNMFDIMNFASESGTSPW
jgi:hypothetical protein